MRQRAWRQGLVHRLLTPQSEGMRKHWLKRLPLFTLANAGETLSWNIFPVCEVYCHNAVCCEQYQYRSGCFLF